MKAMTGPILLIMLAAFGLSVSVIYLRLRFFNIGLALPDHRSMHSRPTPHGGGLGIVVALLICGYWAGVDWIWLISIVSLAGISWLDDWRHLPFWIRLIMHFVISASVVFCHAGAFTLSLAVAVVVIVWMINAYNFMDGMDGLAGSMAITGFPAYCAGLLWYGDFALAALCAAAAASALGFLLFNWHPAKIFMGDIGSIPLGLLAGGVGWYGFMIKAWPLWFPLLVFSPFLYDATVTLARRILKKKRFWEAHREHYYQHMVLLGRSHAQVCRMWLTTMLLISLTAVILLKFAPGAGWVVLIVCVASLAAYGGSVDLRWARINENDK